MKFEAGSFCPEAVSSLSVKAVEPVADPVIVSTEAQVIN